MPQTRPALEWERPTVPLDQGGHGIPPCPLASAACDDQRVGLSRDIRQRQAAAIRHSTALCLFEISG
jgi:hypothetical protein